MEMSGLRHAPCLVRAAMLALIASSPMIAQPATAEMQALQNEVRTLRRELDDLRAEFRRLEGTLKTKAEPAPGPTAAEADADAVSMLQTQVAELAQTKVESNSRHPIKVFGSIVSNTFYNSGEPSWLDNPHLALAAPAGLPRGDFSSSLRQSRLGLLVEGPGVGSMRSSGTVEVDFYGGVPNYPIGQVMGLPRLLYAYMRLEGERTAFEFGQDQMILAPRNPRSVAALYFPSLYSSGNLYLRLPQIRAEHRLRLDSDNELEFTGGALAPVAGTFGTNSAYTLFLPKLEGERSRQPSLQGRLAWRHGKKNVEGPARWEIGLSGHHGEEQFTQGRQSSWASAIDLDFQRGRFGFGGEWFAGRNIDAFGGSLGQLAKSTGGYLEGRLSVQHNWEVNGGFGVDRLYDRREFAPQTFKQNFTFFTNTIFHLSPEWVASLEYRWLSTQWRVLPVQRNSHLNLTFAYSF